MMRTHTSDEVGDSALPVGGDAGRRGRVVEILGRHRPAARLGECAGVLYEGERQAVDSAHGGWPRPGPLWSFQDRADIGLVVTLWKRQSAVQP
jgi:hypothetical protein